MKTTVTRINMDQFVTFLEAAVTVVDLDGGCQLLMLTDGNIVHFNAVSSDASMIELNT